MESKFKDYLKGFIGGSLILVFCAFVYGQYQFSAYQKVLFIGTIDGAWTDPVPVVKKK